MKLLLDTLSAWAVPLLLAGIPLYALTRKVNVYAAFLEGARGGFETGVRIVPPLVVIRPLSGGAALGVVGDVLRSEGPDSYAGRLVSVMCGSTETTFYVLAVYFGAAGITRYRHALPAALLADLAGMTAAVVVVRLLFGG